ncbi:hypothetical protein Pint_31059 [Pistacia integerrima]|uniref:Uncharacterized protein n=1 Tax=Pistacia integerrima TaxID=434235 RepID=A0ACC0XLR0_9ROSI|nr:hypothetical protein Pint_31059 [Pistacia integerrima]
MDAMLCLSLPIRGHNLDGGMIELPLGPHKDLDVYEMNVRAFTTDESSGLDPDIHGSYLGFIEKVILLCIEPIS